MTELSVDRSQIIPRATGNGSDGKFRPCLDRFIKIVCFMLDRGARYKVYAIANTSQVSTPHRRHPVTTCRFLTSAYKEQAHLGARADREARLRESRHRCRIDRTEALVQRRVAQREPGQAPRASWKAMPAVATGSAAAWTRPSNRRSNRRKRASCSAAFKFNSIGPSALREGEKSSRRTRYHGARGDGGAGGPCNM